MVYTPRRESLDKYLKPLMVDAIRMGIHLKVDYDQMKRYFDECFKEVKYNE